MTQSGYADQNHLSQKRCKSVLYCILTHNGPKQTERLLRAIYNEYDQFVVHVDQSAAPSYKDLLSDVTRGLENVRVISTRACSWGGFSLVQGTLDMLKLGLSIEGGWGHAILLSATHLPLWPLDRIRDWLPAGKSVMNWYELPPVEPGWLRGLADRIEWEYEEKPKVGMQAKQKIGRPNFRYFKGSQWSVLSRGHVEYVTRNEPSDIVERLGRSNVADESFFQTVLLNSSYSSECKWGASTASIWSQGAASPATLDLQGYQQAVTTFQNPFVRKIAEDLGDESQVIAVVDEIMGCPPNSRILENIWNMKHKEK